MKVSIIIPVYNVEKKIKYTIDSVLQQSFTEFELILVNDGSIDESGRICDEYSQVDSRVVTKHIENSGVSNARNIGIELARGEYIQFIDSDDTIEKNMVGKLFYNIEHREIDLVTCGYNLIDEVTRKIISKINDEEGIYTISEFNLCINKFFSNNTFNSPCNKIYVSSIIKSNNIIFDNTIDLGEDLLFNLTYLKYCKNIKVLDLCLYNYFINNNASLAVKFRANIHLSLLKLLEEKHKFLIDNDSYIMENKSYIQKEYLITVIGAINMLYHINSTLTKKECIQSIKDITDCSSYRNCVEKCNINLSIQDKFIHYNAKRSKYMIIYMFFKFKFVLRNNIGFIFNFFKNLNKLNL